MCIHTHTHTHTHFVFTLARKIRTQLSCSIHGRLPLTKQMRESICRAHAQREKGRDGWMEGEKERGRESERESQRAREPDRVSVRRRLALLSLSLSFALSLSLSPLSLTQTTQQAPPRQLTIPHTSSISVGSHPRITFADT
jgi:hypothetical protein